MLEPRDFREDFGNSGILLGGFQLEEHCFGGEIAVVKAHGAEIGVPRDDLFKNVLNEARGRDPALILFDRPVHDLRDAQDLRGRFYTKNTPYAISTEEVEEFHDVGIPAEIVEVALNAQRQLEVFLFELVRFAHAGLLGKRGNRVL